MNRSKNLTSFVCGCHAPKVPCSKGTVCTTVPVSVQETYTMIHIHFIISFEFLFSAGSHWPCVINLPVNRDRDVTHALAILQSIASLAVLFVLTHASGNLTVLAKQGEDDFLFFLPSFSFPRMSFHSSSSRSLRTRERPQASLFPVLNFNTGIILSLISLGIVKIPNKLSGLQIRGGRGRNEGGIVTHMRLGWEA